MTVGNISRRRRMIQVQLDARSGAPSCPARLNATVNSATARRPSARSSKARPRPRASGLMRHRDQRLLRCRATGLVLPPPAPPSHQPPQREACIVAEVLEADTEPVALLDVGLCDSDHGPDQADRRADRLWFQVHHPPGADAEELGGLNASPLALRSSASSARGCGSCGTPIRLTRTGSR